MNRVFGSLFLIVVLVSIGLVVASEIDVGFYIDDPNESDYVEDVVVEDSSWGFFEYFVLIVLVLAIFYIVFGKGKSSGKKKKVSRAKPKSRVRTKKKK